jgi:A/G-specific adenine glycosylase
VSNNFQKKLLQWFSNSGRELPWRNTSDPFRIWISEIMLQQTQVQQVIPYYSRFLQVFPDVQVLARAELTAVLKAWEGMGYYARARNLHRAAQIICQEFGGVFPSNSNLIRKLPGIGPYTAAAIASIAFNEDVPVLDGNVLRVLSRLTAFSLPARTPAGKKLLFAEAEKLLAKGRAGDFNQAMMELGAMICIPANPLCDICPVRSHCQALAQNAVEQYPLKNVAKKRPHHVISAGIIWHKNKILIARRPEKGLLGGLWEFPGGKVEQGETLEFALQREIKEELDIDVAVTGKMMQLDHQYTHFTITLHVFHCAYLAGEPKAIGCIEWRWVDKMELRNLAFPRANTKIIDQLLAE